MLTLQTECTEISRITLTWPSNSNKFFSRCQPRQVVKSTGFPVRTLIMETRPLKRRLIWTSRRSCQQSVRRVVSPWKLHDTDHPGTRTMCLNLGTEYYKNSTQHNHRINHMSSVTRGCCLQQQPKPYQKEQSWNVTLMRVTTLSIMLSQCIVPLVLVSRAGSLIILLLQLRWIQRLYKVHWHKTCHFLHRCKHAAFSAPSVSTHKSNVIRPLKQVSSHKI
jgi:hypothetical protein